VRTRASLLALEALVVMLASALGTGLAWWVIGKPAPAHDRPSTPRPGTPGVHADPCATCRALDEEHRRLVARRSN
jgi:hypothetical protein